MVWTARHTQCRPTFTNMISHHQCSLARHFILGPVSKIVSSIVFHDEGSFHAADVSAHAESRISIQMFGAQNNSTNTILTDSKV